MAKFAVQLLVAVAAVCLLMACGQRGAAARPSPDSDLSNMVEALRVLEQYDKMYSQLARPR